MTHALILASGSPRRRELMALLGLSFTVATADVDERPQPAEDPRQTVQRLSQAKARAAAGEGHRGLIVAADTVVVLDGHILGKPRDGAEATRMLRRLRGTEHRVYSGLTVLDTESGQALTGLVESRVWMRPYSDDEIARYVASNDPLDKAGAYAIQHAEFAPVARLEGCYASVMGFPLCHLWHMLRRMGVCPPTSPIEQCAARTNDRCALELDFDVVDNVLM